MRKLLKALFSLAALAIVAALAIAALSNTAAGPVKDAADTAKNAAANAALDASGLKSQAQSALEAQAPAIAEASGLPLSTVEAGIDALSIETWQAASLPDDAQPVRSFDAAALGGEGTVTTYADPSYLTVEAYGQSLTLQIPESAQESLGYLAFL